MYQLRNVMKLGRKLASFLSCPMVWIPLLSLIWAVLLVFNVVPMLRGGFGWRNGYAPVLDWHRTVPLILGILIYIAGALWLERRPRVAGLLVWAMVGSVGLALAAAFVRAAIIYRLYSLTIGGIDGGWHMAATRITDLAATLSHWPQFMTDSRAFSTHMAISPPGMVLFYYAANAVLGYLPSLTSALASPLRWFECRTVFYTNAQFASAWLGMLMPVWSRRTSKGPP